MLFDSWEGCPILRHCYIWDTCGYVPWYTRGWSSRLISQWNPTYIHIYINKSPISGQTDVPNIFGYMPLISMIHHTIASKIPTKKDWLLFHWYPKIKHNKYKSHWSHLISCTNTNGRFNHIKALGFPHQSSLIPILEGISDLGPPSLPQHALWRLQKHQGTVWIFAISARGPGYARNTMDSPDKLNNFMVCKSVLTEGSLEVKLPTDNMDRWKSRGGKSQRGEE